MTSAGAVIDLIAVIVAVTEDDTPRTLIVRRPRQAQSHHPLAPEGVSSLETVGALPYGPFDPVHDRTLELSLRAWVKQQTGLDLGYVEQLYTFGDRYRDPREKLGGPRVVSIGYLALTREAKPSGTGDAEWRDWYDFFPWEDWRHERPDLIERAIVPALTKWAAADLALEAQRAERIGTLFGATSPWDFERVLERFELLYEAGLVPEALRDQTAGQKADATHVLKMPGRRDRLGRALAWDHRRILATALGRLRGKLKYRPIMFELLPPNFTLLRLQRAVEAFAGVQLHKQNFRRLVVQGGLVEATKRSERTSRGRPARLYRFRGEVWRERPAPGVGIPTPRTQRAAKSKAGSRR